MTNWTATLPALLALLENGTPEARKFAERELRRMAEAADRFVAFSQEPR